MSKLYFNKGQLAEDIWVQVADDAPLQNDTPSIISLSRFKEQAASLAERTGPLGVRIDAGSKQGEDVEEIADRLDQLDLIAIDFPAFRNGRGYSTARILREHLGFSGELRAMGEVLIDQLIFMHRCGFSSYEIDTEQNKSLDSNHFTDAFARFPDAYQPAGDDNRGILWHRGQS
jgi:uncharacterized protein (DUF934 family)